MLKRWMQLLVGIGIFLFFAGILWWWLSQGMNVNRSFISPQGTEILPDPTPLPLLNYSFENLSNRIWTGSEIEIENLIEEKEAIEEVDRYLFFVHSEGKRVSGMMIVPEDLDLTSNSEIYPVIVMLRGYVDKSIYTTGIGTARAAEVFAQNGFVTFALDYLGFAESDEGFEDVWHERFSKPVQVMSLISSFDSLPFVDQNRVGLWGHSNGGQVALSVLEISKEEFPTTLWAPVTKPFPYSILYYTDESDDEGMSLRKELSRLEQDYDVRDYSIRDYLDWIEAPIQLHQGTADDAIPAEWSREFVAQLKRDNDDVKIEYFEYPGADHNLSGSWNQVVKRDLEFFSEYFN